MLCAYGFTVDHIRGDGRLERERKFSPMGGERAPMEGALFDVPEERPWRSTRSVLPIYTIGFTKKSAAEFFETLRRAGIRRLIDVRLKNSAQLAGFTKRDDLAYFLREICGAEYRHEPLLAPTPEMLECYRKRHVTWDEYERQFLRLMEQRRIDEVLDPALFAIPTVLLCSEPTAERCHRRLVVEFLRAPWKDVRPVHL